jgi:DNA-binding GntR family transcriptional regulator
MIDEFETLGPYDAEELFRLGSGFHATLVEPCPHEYLRSMLAGIWSHPIQRRISMTYFQGSEHQAGVARDHSRILNVLANNDPETMVDVLRRCNDPQGRRSGLGIRTE